MRGDAKEAVFVAVNRGVPWKDVHGAVDWMVCGAVGQEVNLAVNGAVGWEASNAARGDLSQLSEGL